MPKISSLILRVLAASLTAVFVLGSVAWAQQPAPTVRIRGAIEAVDGSLLTVKSREGTEIEGARDRQRGGVRRRQDSVVGNQARLLHRRLRDAGAGRHPEGARGSYFPRGPSAAAAEGFRPWDLRPNSTIDQRHRRRDGRGDRRPETSWSSTRTAKRKSWCHRIRRLSHSSRGDKSELKPGAKYHYLRRHQERGRHAGSRPRQRRPRRHYAADVRAGRSISTGRGALRDVWKIFDGRHSPRTM